MKILFSGLGGLDLDIGVFAKDIDWIFKNRKFTNLFNTDMYENKFPFKYC